MWQRMRVVHSRVQLKKKEEQQWLLVLARAWQPLLWREELVE